ncbi:MAG: hypothetical protein WDM85_15825 [Caulobacteraceae bacterium]
MSANRFITVPGGKWVEPLNAMCSREVGDAALARLLVAAAGADHQDNRHLPGAGPAHHAVGEPVGQLADLGFRIGPGERVGRIVAPEGGDR